VRNNTSLKRDLELIGDALNKLYPVSPRAQRVAFSPDPLTTGEVAAIRRLRARGATASELAEEFRVSELTINTILKGAK
jgi:hypothetical protein